MQGPAKSTSSRVSSTVTPRLPKNKIRKTYTRDYNQLTLKKRILRNQNTFHYDLLQDLGRMERASSGCGFWYFVLVPQIPTNTPPHTHETHRGAATRAVPAMLPPPVTPRDEKQRGSRVGVREKTSIPLSLKKRIRGFRNIT